MSVSAPLIRVCRKRTADPQTALLVSVKRQRPSAAQADPLLYQLLTTSDTPLAPKDNAKVIDYATPRSRPSTSAMVVEEVDETAEVPFAHLTNAVGEVGGDKEPKPVPKDVITCNGAPLVVCGEDDLVYDFYEMTKGDAATAENEEDLEMRFMSQEEFTLWMEAASDSDDDHGDDDDDSNDENNWRNEYPDEESGSDEDSDTYSEDYDEDDADSEFEGLRMRQLSIRDSTKEAVFNPEDTEDDES